MTQSTGMNIFSESQLQKVIADTLPQDAVPNEKVVVGTVNEQGAKVVASFKFKQGASGFAPSWELQAAAEHDWDGNNSVGSKVILRWK